MPLVSFYLLLTKSSGFFSQLLKKSRIVTEKNRNQIYDFCSSSFVLLRPFNFSNANINACVPNFALPSAAKIS